MRIHVALPVALALLCLLSCRNPANESPPPNVKSFVDLAPGSNDWLFTSSDSLDRSREVSISLTLPSSATDVYVLLTSVAGTASKHNLGVVEPLPADSRSTEPPTRLVSPPASGQTEPARGAPRVELSSLRPAVSLPAPRSSRGRSLNFSAVPPTYSVNAAGTFIDSLSDSSHPMTLHKVQMNATVGRTLYVWVVDDCWVGSDPSLGSSRKITQAMVDALAQEFLDTDADLSNDIYGLVTNLLGKEWADTGEPTTADGAFYNGELIDGGGQIHIVIGDLNPEDDFFGGGLMGYFHGRNNVETDEFSNKKVMFAIDANNLANSDDDGYSETSEDRTTWSLSDYWPAEVISTLAHEFQHMIHFYQKQVRNGLEVETDTWINEMASMAVEDLVADKLGVRGPRGMPGNNYGTPDVDPKDHTYSSLIFDGRLPLFNRTHDSVPLQYWPSWGSSESSLPSYSNAYAFGAWLTRNYGGPALWKALVQSSGTGVNAVIDAVNASGNLETYASLTRKWGLAAFLSSGATLSSPRYSNGDSGFTFPAVGSVTYRTGSINLYSYANRNLAGQFYVYSNYDPVTGPWVWNAAPAGDSEVGDGATWMYWQGVGVGPWTHTLRLPANVEATVVVHRR